MRIVNLFIAILLLTGAGLAFSQEAPESPASAEHATTESILPVSSLPPEPHPTILSERNFSAILDTAGSGSICPEGPTPVDNGDTPAIIGEVNDRYDCEGYWTFEMDGLPSSSTVLSAMFLPGICTMSGSPFSNGDLGFELVDLGDLDISDYGKEGVGYFQGSEIAVSFNNCSPKAINITNHVSDQMKKDVKIIQIRAYLTAGNFSNGVDDYVSFRTGNTPTIVVLYR